MRRCFLPVLVLSLGSFFVAAGSPALAADQPLRAVNLRCEYLTNPLGVGETSPRLGWMLESTQNGDRQLAYRILVASSTQKLAGDIGDLWDSGKVESDESNFIVYSGTPLQSRDACFWKVQVFSALGGDGQWSDSASWTMGLLKPADWSAKWIDSSAAMAKAAAADPVKIISASYRPVARATTSPTSSATASTSPANTDVTARLQSLVSNGAIDITVDNATLGGDPAPDQKKHLEVRYEYQSEEHHITVEEKGNLSIPKVPGPVWQLQKSFTADPGIRKATLYATALGLYEMRINGQPVSDNVLTPGWTDYRKRVRYQAYDVTSLIKPGDNALSSLLARGWYAGHLGNGGYNEYGKTPALLAQLEITRADGSVQTVDTDESWTTAQSAIISSDFMLGESYDARKQSSAVNGEKTNAPPAWSPVSVRKSPEISIDWQVAPPVRQTGEIKPIQLTQPKPGHWTFDLGQNMVGVVRLKVTQPAGTVITLHHAEMLKADGSIYTTNLRGAPSVDTYTCRGGGEETWQPTFTFHGFRYVELTGLTEKPTMDAVTGIVLGSDTPRNSSFECSDPRVNQLMSNIQWGQRGNYLSVPTDCPQRDERLGWMGDAQVFVRTATDNADVAAFFSKWLVDVDDAQSPEGAFTDVSPRRGSGDGTPAWGDAGVICPWTIYCAYGDRRLLQRNLPAMTKWVEWCKAHSNNLIRDNRDSRGGDFGDWLSIKADTPKDLIGTAYFAYSTHLLAKSYAAVGDNAMAVKYQDLFDQIKAAFNKKYVAPDGRITGNTQCCYAMALKFELLPNDLRPLAAKYLVQDIQQKDWHLSTGFVGVSYLLPTLTNAGEIDTAYRLLLQDTFPSWLFSVKHGATTIWERWDGWTPDRGFQDPGMNSFNHYSLGSVGEWLYDTVAGITWDESQPGYRHILIHPQPGGNLTYAKATLGSIYGPIISDWKITDGALKLNVTIPPGTTATVEVPAKPGDNITTNAGTAKSAGNYQIGSGSYWFESRP